MRTHFLFPAFLLRGIAMPFAEELSTITFILTHGSRPNFSAVCYRKAICAQQHRMATLPLTLLYLNV